MTEGGQSDVLQNFSGFAIMLPSILPMSQHFSIRPSWASWEMYLHANEVAIQC